MWKTFLSASLLLLFAGCASVPVEATQSGTKIANGTGRAIFAGGCFWCVESAFEQLDGVSEVISGYTGGDQPNPTYQEVSSGSTGHTEAIEVHFDPQVISYQELLEVFWKNIDPTDAAGQFVDRGRQYRSGIFYLSKEQQRLARASKKALAESGRFQRPIVTEILPAGPFYRAEDYHQDYYAKNPLRYWIYTNGSGRKEFKQKYWDDAKQDTSD